MLFMERVSPQCFLGQGELSPKAGAVTGNISLSLLQLSHDPYLPPLAGFRSKHSSGLILLLPCSTQGHPSPSQDNIFHGQTAPRTADGKIVPGLTFPDPSWSLESGWVFFFLGDVRPRNK